VGVYTHSRLFLLLMDKIEFIATLPPIQSAILLDGNGDGARIKLDITRQYIEAILQLQSFAGKNLKIIAEVQDE